MAPVRKKPWTAAALSLAAAGLGHLYCGRPRTAVLIQSIALFLPVLMALGIRLKVAPATPLIGRTLATEFLLWVGAAIHAAFTASRAPADSGARAYQRAPVYAGFVLASFVLAAGLNLAVNTFLVHAYRVPSSSMEPALFVGDYFFVDMQTYDERHLPKRGDVVIVRSPESPGSTFIKRVIGLPGETLEIRDRIVLVDGRRIREPYAVFRSPKPRPRSFQDPVVFPRGAGNGDNYGPITIPAGGVFVMGDNRDNSDDSRYFGCIDLGDVEGRASSIYWSWGENGMPRVMRIGRKIR